MYTTLNVTYPGSSLCKHERHCGTDIHPHFHIPKWCEYADIPCLKVDFLHTQVCEDKKFYTISNMLLPVQKVGPWLIWVKYYVLGIHHVTFPCIRS
jgi:hypothetical protein